MKPFSILVVITILTSAATAPADIAIVVQHQWTIDNNYFSAFAHDPATDEFRSGGYSSNQTVRWSHVLDDSLEPWSMEGDVILNWFQLGLFARDGYASNSGSFALWGMNFNPLDGKYFLTGIGILKPPSGSTRLDAERDLVILDDRLPDSLLSLPTGTILSNVGGIYRLKDESLDPNGLSRAAFLSSGVQPGDRITLFPVDIWAEVLSATYIVTQVISETEIRLDRDPCWGPGTTTTGVGYLLSIQPHITLATFRQNIPYYAADSTKGPKVNYTGGLSLDGQTLYLGDIVSGYMIAVDTQVKESFSIFTAPTDFAAYVQAQVNAGRRMVCIGPEVVYTDSLPSDWDNLSVNTTVNFSATTPLYSGSKSMAVTYAAAGATLDLESLADPNAILQAADYDHVQFAIHGGGTGGRQITFHAYDIAGTPGTTIVVPSVPANDWLLVQIPVPDLGVTTIGGFVWQNTAAGAQPTFYLDEITMPYIDPPPAGVGEFDPNEAGPASAQIAVDGLDRIWFAEAETDDILWTTNGVDFSVFLTSNEIAPVTGGYSGSFSDSTGVQVMGLTSDRMGTVYWSDNRTNGIWKAPACGGAEHIRCLATSDELKAALGLASSPRGLNCFTIRGDELLTFNFVEGNFIFKVDLDTFDYGDFDGDVDTDGADFNLFEDVVRGPDITTPPPGLEDLFQKSDLDLDGDVDLFDVQKLQMFATGSLP